MLEILSVEQNRHWRIIYDGIVYRSMGKRFQAVCEICEISGPPMVEFVGERPGQGRVLICEECLEEAPSLACKCADRNCPEHVEDSNEWSKGTKGRLNDH